MIAVLAGLALAGARYAAGRYWFRVGFNWWEAVAPCFAAVGVLLVLVRVRAVGRVFVLVGIAVSGYLFGTWLGFELPGHAFWTRIEWTAVITQGGVLAASTLALAASFGVRSRSPRPA